MSRGAGGAHTPAFKTSTSQLPIASATFLIAGSSVTEQGNTETLVESLETSFSVSRRVDSVRPIRTRCFADAFANAMAVARPIPEPYIV